MSARAWLLAARPRTLPAAVSPVLVGTAMAHWQGVSAFGPALAALLGAVFIQIGTNLANDYFDFRKGADTDDRLGPVRVVQAGLLPPETVIRGALLTLGMAFGVGIYLVWVGGLPIVVIGLTSLVLALVYTGGPYPLAYNGLGDVFVFLYFGLVAVAGTYWVQALDFRGDLLLAGSGVGSLITAILVVNNLRDREQDARAGKKTLAVRLGVAGSRLQYALLLAVGVAAPILGIRVYDWPEWTLMGLGALVFLIRPLITVLAFRDPRELNPTLGWTARGVAWYAGLMALGFILT
jgi:1,4-dihydroxy-2-naphthoate polyprenyltransferase